MKKGKIDNSFLEGKIQLREKFLLENNDYNVLDVFGGKGIIWNRIIKRNPNLNIKITALEIEKGKNKRAIEGDNLKTLPNLDLSVYDVIDIDAYGSSFKQLQAIVKNGTFRQDVIFFTTDIFVMQGKAPNALFNKIGITNKMIRKNPSLFTRKRDVALKHFLYTEGVRKIKVYNPTAKKNYRGFLLDNKEI
ncbi:MAG: hypothetical protein JJV88_04810 [Sulfurovum sp.]|nr:hypothetical protein [Sulfurovaceae bacterium]